MAIPYGKQDITQEDVDAVINALQSDFLTQGPRIAEFENEFASYIGAKYAVAVSNGTTALHLCALVLEVGEDTNVITTPITFVASANCIRYAGGTVWFADIDPITYTLDIEKVENLIKSKPAGFFKGIIPVDFAGFAVNLESFKALAEKYNLWIIEDACHSPGGYFIDSKGIRQNCGNGNFADMAVFSFHPVKHIACGEGGMITTNSERLYNKLLLLRTHGITKAPELLKENHGGWYYEMQTLGYNYRLTDFQAALGTSQLKKAGERLQRRLAIARRYNQHFQNRKYVISHSGLTEGHAYHLYIIQTLNRKELYDFLKNKEIHCQIHYIPVHKMPYYAELATQEDIFPISEGYYSHCLSLPMYPTLTDEEQAYVLTQIDEFFDTRAMI